MKRMTTDVSGHFDGHCVVENLGLIRVQGSDAAKFLHSQLSNDFEHLDTRNARLAAYCTPQGRMLASFFGLRRSDQEIWLACSADLLAPTLKRLSMFVLRLKAKLGDASPELAFVGMTGTSAQAWLERSGAAGALSAPWSKADVGSASIVRLPDAAGQARWAWIGPRAEVQTAFAGLPALDAEVWRWLDVTSGVVPVVAATASQFVPQMLNYELVGGVDFRKGCYPGQEVVARSQYLGKLKRRAYLLHGQADMPAGTEVFWSGDENQPAGMVAGSAANPSGGFDALVELKSAVLAEGTLHARSLGGPVLTPLPMPYEIPAEAAARSTERPAA